MASVKLAVVVLLCAVATTATANRPYQPKPQPQPQPQPEHEDCKTQAMYFKNCLSLGLHEKCCDKKSHVAVTEDKCYCEVEREAQIECAPGRHCSKIEGKVKIAELKLSCLKKLKCKHA